jgi:predicted DNA-binding protein
MADMASKDKETLSKLTAVRLSPSEHERLLAYGEKIDRKPAWIFRTALLAYLKENKA